MTLGTWYQRSLVYFRILESDVRNRSVWMHDASRQMRAIGNHNLIEEEQRCRQKLLHVIAWTTGVHISEAFGSFNLPLYRSEHGNARPSLKLLVFVPSMSDSAPSAVWILVVWSILLTCLFDFLHD